MLLTRNTTFLIFVFIFSLIAPALFSSWIIYISPYKSIYSTFYSIIFSLSYIVLLSLVLILSGKYFKSNNINNDIDISNIINIKVVWILFTLVLIGVGLHMYDKIVIRGYDYFSDAVSIRTIRHQWISAGKDREGSFVSSWQSGFGYVFSFLYFPLAYLTIIGKYELSTKQKYIILFFSTLGVSLVAYTVASRSTLLFLAIFVASLYVLLFVRKDYKKKLNLLLPVFLSFIVIIVLISNDQIKNVKNFNNYASGYEDELNIIVKDDSKYKKTSRLQDIISLVFLYANHGQNNFEYTVHQETHPGTMILKSITGVLNKFGIIEYNPEKRTYGRGMISAYGAIWYDLGTIGFYIFSILNAILFVLIIKGLVSNSIMINLISQISFSFFILLNIMSPLTLALNIMVAPFYIFSMLLLIIMIITYTTYYKRNI